MHRLQVVLILPEEDLATKILLPSSVAIFIKNASVELLFYTCILHFFGIGFCDNAV
jgi:hypothetical protein